MYDLAIAAGLFEVRRLLSGTTKPFRHVGQEHTTPPQPISRDQAYRLIHTPIEGLPELLAEAREARDRFKPGIITYSRKVFIPLTNLCRDYCGYCTFRRDPSDPGAHTMTPEEVLHVV